jgi:hypothetical protein
MPAVERRLGRDCLPVVFPGVAVCGLLEPSPLCKPPSSERWIGPSLEIVPAVGASSTLFPTPERLGRRWRKGEPHVGYGR